MKITYDKGVDAAYIYLTVGGKGEVAKNLSLQPSRSAGRN